MAGKKKKKDNTPVHEALKGLDIGINELGEITSTIDIKKINDFLDKHTDDKKLRGQKNHAQQQEQQEEE